MGEWVVNFFTMLVAPFVITVLGVRWRTSGRWTYWVGALVVLAVVCLGFTAAIEARQARDLFIPGMLFSASSVTTLCVLRQGWAHRWKHLPLVLGLLTYEATWYVGVMGITELGWIGTPHHPTE